MHSCWRYLWKNIYCQNENETFDGFELVQKLKSVQLYKLAPALTVSIVFIGFFLHANSNLWRLWEIMGMAWIKTAYQVASEGLRLWRIVKGYSIETEKLTY